MRQDYNFDDIRPFNDEELASSIQNLSKDATFGQLMNFFFPKWKQEDLDEISKKIHSYEDFYRLILSEIARKVIASSMKGLSVEGLEHLETGQGYTFISTHRDILTDSGLLNYVLYQHGHRFVETAIGNNLVHNELVSMLISINQNFLVRRDVERHDLYASSLKLAAYIEHVLKNKGKSVWIAQREGRTKNGDDRTQIGVPKMMGLNGPSGEKAAYYNSLRICPVAISYEIEPCADSKVNELYSIETTGTYKKEYDEDLRSMIAGAIGDKGRVHISIGKPIKLDPEAGMHDKLLAKEIASRVDKFIHQNFKLWPNNYVAYDLLHEKSEYADYYTPEEKSDFVKHVYKELTHLPVDREIAKRLMHELYANPLLNRKSN